MNGVSDVPVNGNVDDEEDVDGLGATEPDGDELDDIEELGETDADGDPEGTPGGVDGEPDAGHV
jgi:hypothetical protein